MNVTTSSGLVAQCCRHTHSGTRLSLETLERQWDLPMLLAAARGWLPPIPGSARKTTVTDHPTRPSPDQDRPRPDEDEIVNAAREGSAEAFTALVAAYQARVRGYLARWVRDAATVDDLAQEVFLAAYRNLRGFDGAVPIGAWFAGIARNQALTHLRSLRRKRAREADAFAAAFQDWHLRALESDGDRLADRLTEIEALRGCLAALSDAQRALVEEHYLGGRTYAMIARERNQEQGAVRMAMLRVRQTLRGCLERRLDGGLPA
jgi:RNA polymerase sigma-70 factor (ECF subfamily)